MGNVCIATTPKARKEHRCDACEWVSNFLADILPDLTYAEKRALVTARRHKYRIRAGEPYVRQFIVDSGYAYTFKAIPAIHDICLRLDLYQE